MAARKGGSRERLLDAAEALFAERGFDGASTRDIAVRAGDTLGTLGYYFSSKENLLLEVLSRRWAPINDHRRELYCGFAKQAPMNKVSLDESIEAIARPFLERALGPDAAWRSYTSLVGRALQSRSAIYSTKSVQLFDPVVKELLGWLHDSAPDASSADIVFGYQLLIGCLVEVSLESERERFRRVGDNVARPAAPDDVIAPILRFVQNGFRACILYGKPG